MKMILKMFCCDLDNTLMYSWRRPLKEKKQCVEWLDGREISYMTEAATEGLKRLREKLLFVPLTTRTPEQYQRIVFPGGVPELALVCNGGILLEKGEIVQDWHRKSLELIHNCCGEMERGKVILEKDVYRSLDVRWIQGLFLFTKSERPDELGERLRETLDLEQVEVFVSRKKIYVIPKVLHKGMALERLRKRLGAETVFAAGDGELDLPMLAAADFAAAPVELRERMKLGEDVKLRKDVKLRENVKLREGMKLGEDMKLRETAEICWLGGVFSDEMLSWILHRV